MKKNETISTLSLTLAKVCLVIFLAMWGFPQAVHAQQLTVLKSANSNMVQSGQVVQFTIQGGCTSELNNCNDAVLTDTLPVGANIIEPIPAFNINSGEGVDVNGDPVMFTIQPTYDPVERVITWDFRTIQPENGLPDGASFTATYSVMITPGEIEDGSIISNTAGYEPVTYGVPVSSTEDIVVMAEPLWDVSKSKVGDRPIYHDEDITYRIVVDPVSSLGNTNLSNVVVTDVLPEGAVLVSVPAGASYDMGTRTLTWMLGDLDVTDPPVVLDVTVNYPYPDPDEAPDPNFTGAATIVPKVNTATLTADAVGEDDQLVLMDTEEAPLNPPFFSLGIVKTADNSGNIPVGLTNAFNIGVENNSTRAVDNFIVRDQIPTQFDLERIGFNAFPAGFPVTVTITLGNGSMQTLMVTTSDEIDVLADFTLGTDYVAAVEFDFGTVPSEFSGSIALAVTPNQAPDGSLVSNTGDPYSEGDSFINTATLDGFNPLQNEDLDQATSSEDMCILPEANTRVDPDKSVEIDYVTPPPGNTTTGNPYFPGSQVLYTLNVENDGPDGNIANFVSANTSTATLITPIVTDLLPPGMMYVVGSSAIVNNNAPGANIASVEPTIETNWNGVTGATLLVWTFNGNFAVGEDLQIQFNATIDEQMAMSNQMGDVVTNQYAIGSPDPASVLSCGGVDCGSPQTDVAAMFPNGSGVTEYCEAFESFTIRFETAIPYVEKANVTGGSTVYVPSGVSLPNTSNTVQFVTTFGNDPMASFPLPNFQAFDLLPAEVTYVDGSLTLLDDPANPAFIQPMLNLTANVDTLNGVAVVPAPAADDVVIEIFQNYNGTGRTLIRWSFTGEFRIADGVSYSFNTLINENQAPGDFTNLGQVTAPMFTDLEIECPNNDFTVMVMDTFDLNNNGSTTDMFCAAPIPSPVTIIAVNEMTATKRVQGENDAMFLRPGPASTNYNGSAMDGSHDGIVDWRLEIGNPGNVTLENVRIYDIFPYIGDVGVQNTGDGRDSEWQPDFFSFDNITVGGVPYEDAPRQMLIEYSTSTNPCRSEIFIPPFMEPAGCVDDWADWQGIDPGTFDFATIRAIRITFADPLLPGETVIVDVQQQAPDYGETDVEPGAIAWNSIARVAAFDPIDPTSDPFDPTSIMLQVPPQEPNKVGVRLEALDLAIRKELCGTEDRIAAPGDPTCFNLTLINQGSTTVNTATIHDYNDVEFELVNTGGLWTTRPDITVGSETFEVFSRVLTPGNGLPAGGLAPGAEVVIEVMYTVDNNVNLFGEALLNRIEISAAEDEFGNDLDYDGDFDNTPLNDNGGTGADPADPNENNNVDGDAFGTPPTDEDNADPSYICVIELNAGDDTEFCPNQLVDISALNSSVMPAPGNGVIYTWTSSGAGVFVNGTGGQAASMLYEDAVSYIPTVADIVNQTVTFTLTTSSTVDGLCDDLTDQVVITFSAGCGTLAGTVSCEGPTTSPMDPSGAIQVSATNFVAGNVQTYLLVARGAALGTGTILAVSPAGTFPNLEAGDYDVFAINYDPTDVRNQDGSGNDLIAPYLAMDEDIDDLYDGGIYEPSGPLAAACFQVCGITLTVPDCYSVGSTVFIDNDNNGMFDQDTDGMLGTGTDEVGIEGVTVQLLDAAGDVIATTTTDTDGNYYFGGLDAGDYQVNIPTTPTGHPNSSGPTTTVDDGPTNVDNDDNGIQTEAFAPTISSVFTLGDLTGPNEPTAEIGEGGEQDEGLGGIYDANGDMTIDFGFVPDMSIGSFVWIDANNDGLFGPGEMGLDGITVELIDVGPDDMLGGGDDVVVATTTTMNDGEYFFSGLFPGNYVVSLPAANFAPGAPGETFPTSSGPTNTTDLGSANVDNDDNGVQAGGSGTVINSPVINLAYNMEPTEGPDATFPGSEQDNNSPVNEETNGDMTIDFGLVPAMSIGSTVFLDSNDNGVQGDDEDGIEGVVVTLYSANPDGTPGTVIAMRTTDGNGDYFFGGLAIDAATNYIVGVTPPAATPLSSTDIFSTATPNNDRDGDDNGIQAMAGDDIFSGIVTLTPGQEPTTATGETGSGSEQDDAMGGAFDNQGNMTVDFGLVPIGSIGSTVFFDDDNNGIQDPGNLGIENILVELYLDADMDGDPDSPTPIATTTTGPDGEYIFENLLPGFYIVGIPTPPTEYLLSSSGDTDTENLDGNDNGIQAMSGGPTFSGTIELTTGNEPFAGSGEDGTNGGQDNEPGDDPLEDSYGDMTVDFGFTPAVSVGSTVFVDINNNGMQDVGDGDVGIPGVTLQLFAAGDDPLTATPIAETTTNANGDYLFDGIPQGDYFIYIPTPDANFPTSSTPTETDGLDNTDGDDNGIQTGGSGTAVVSPVFNLTANTEPTDDDPTNPETESGFNLDDVDDDNGNMTFDFGFFGPVSLGDYTWFDLNGNGVQDDGEPPVAGVTVTVFNADGSPVTVDAEGNLYNNETTTNGAGLYEFTNLPQGNYYVVFDQSTSDGGAFLDFTVNTAPNGITNSDADPATGQTPNTGFLPTGTNFPDLDAGLICNVEVDAGTPRTICSTGAVELALLGASVSPEVPDFGATWTGGDGTFDDGNAGRLGVATTYTPGPLDIANGTVTLTLTTDDPADFDSQFCGPVMDVVTITILQVDCGSFFWNGGN